VRDLLRGKATYGELASSPERIPTNILADRLKRLEEAGLIVSSAYQERPVRYAYKLSAKGEDMSDVLRAFVRWGKTHIPGTKTYADSRLRKKS
jgi:DNA-binding HxlR family transcriptional regulator